MQGHRWFLQLGNLTNNSLGDLMHNANELIHCTYSLYQEVDVKGKPQTGVRVGNISLTYDGLPTDDIIKWAMKPTILYDGVLVLYDANDMPIDKIYFEDAACVAMRLNYISVGKSTVLTQIHLQPRKLKISDEEKERNWQKMPKAIPINSNSQASNLLKLAQPIGKTTLSLELGDKIYEVEKFNVSFNQGVDYKGEPQEETMGGIVDFSIADMPDQQLNRWMMRDTEAKDGVFVFNKGEQSSPLKVFFTEGYCVYMNNQTIMGVGLATNYKVTANEIKLNDVWLYKNFKMK